MSFYDKSLQCSPVSPWSRLSISHALAQGTILYTAVLFNAYTMITIRSLLPLYWILKYIIKHCNISNTDDAGSSIGSTFSAALELVQNHSIKYLWSINCYLTWLTCTPLCKGWLISIAPFIVAWAIKVIHVSPIAVHSHSSDLTLDKCLVQAKNRE